MADDVAPPFDPSKPSEDMAPPFDPSRPSEDVTSPVSGGRAAYEGFKHGATAGLSDALSSVPGGYASTEVEGVPFLSPEQHEQRIKAADEEFKKSYATAKATREAAQAQHPYLYGAGEIGGAAASMAVTPGGNIARGATLGEKAAQAGITGAGYGAIAGGVEGGEQAGLPGAGVGAVTGGILGGTLGAASEPIIAGAKALLRPVTSRIGSAIRTFRDPEAEASRQLLQADTRDMGNIGKTWNPVTQEEQAVAAQTGLPMTAVDVGGPNTRALADWAATTSPEAHAQFTQLNQRLQGARERVGQFVKDMVGGEDLDADRVAINAAARGVNRPAYKATYEAGDRPIWSSELEQLSFAPAVTDALRGAVNKWRNFQVLDGYGGMNPPVRITPDGQLKFLPGKGLLPYPNIQLWDYARRTLTMAAEKAKGEFGKPTTESAMYSGLAAKLNVALDKEVPEYAGARAGAAQFFGAENALKAGAKFVSPQTSFSLGGTRRALAAMSNEERTLFARGYATQAAERVMSGGKGALNTLFGSPQARERAEMAMGPQRARQLEALLRVEEVAKSTQSIHGGSPTARRLAMQTAMGVGFGEGADYLTGALDPRHAATIGGLAGFAFGRGRAALNERLAAQLAKMLVSDDPAIYAKGIELAARVPKALNWLRGATRGATEGAVLPHVPVPQLPASAAASDQQNVPRPPGQQKGGRINAQRQRFADGGAPDDPYDPLAASAGIAPASTPTIDTAVSALGPSWTQQALEQSKRDQDIIARGGNLHDLVRDSEAAQDLAGGFGGGDIGVAGTFGGKLAKTANQAMLARAQRMMEEGAPRESIWNQTGWFQGPDKQWRFEIPDEGAKTRIGAGAGATQPLEHPALFEAYPELRDYPLAVRYSPRESGQISYRGEEPVGIKSLGPDEPTRTSSGLHEFQHGIQGIEDFAKGSSPNAQVLQPTQVDQAARKIVEGMGGNWYAQSPQAKANLRNLVRFNTYQMSAGETEARNVQKRFREGITEQPPWETADIPEDRQIVNFKLPTMQRLEQAGGEDAPRLFTPEEVHPLTINDILHPDTPAIPANSRNNVEIARDLEGRGKQALRDLGLPDRIEGPSPHSDQAISSAIASEIKAALDRDTHTAADWYTTKIDQAMSTAAIMHPELAADHHAKMGYTASLAITSQGERVPSNVRLADQAYEYFKNNGRFPTNIAAKNGPAMNSNFGKLNALLDELGPQGTHDFLHRDFTVKELNAAGYKISGENVNTRVKGSVILGPKIGQGFFQNLNGNYNPVTMDLWFMRAWGRLTGTLVGTTDAAGLAAQEARFVNALRSEGKPVPSDLERAADQITSAHERDFKNNRADYDSGAKKKAELTYAAERYLHGRNGLNEQPGSGSSRTWMRDRVNAAREMLARDGINVTNADLQAIWWYPEKNLYAKMGGRSSEAINVDYATAIADLARKKGVSEADIAGAMGSASRGSRPAGSHVSGRGEGSGAQGQGVAGQRALGGRVNGSHIDASHTVRTGANSSADGTVYVDPRIPARFRKFLAVHETTEQRHMNGGYARAHKIATAAERKAVEASGMSWRHYTAEMDGYLDHIEHEADTDPPKGKLHVSASEALGHHRSENK